MAVHHLHVPDGPGLLDRDEELDSLARLAERARSGQGGVVCVEGRAGAGKSSVLSAWVAAERERGMTVMRAVGTELASGFAFAVVRRLLGPQLGMLPGPDEEAVFRGPARLARQALDSDVPKPAASADLSLGPVYGLYWLTLNLAERG